VGYPGCTKAIKNYFKKHHTPITFRQNNVARLMYAGVFQRKNKLDSPSQLIRIPGKLVNQTDCTETFLALIQHTSSMVFVTYREKCR